MTNKEILQKILEKVEFIENFLLNSIPPDHIIISCDGSIIENPGGPSTIGVVIQMPKQEPIEISRFVPATTNNEAEMDAIYEGVNSLLGLQGDPPYPVEVISDSQIVINGFNRIKSLKKKELVRRRDLILERIGNVRDKFTFTWKPRNSTPGLARANEMAQRLNGVKNTG